MRSDSCADPRFGLNGQALAVLAMLAGRDPGFADWDEVLCCYDVTIYTYPWFNGREKGISLVIQRGYAPSEPSCLILTCAENRTSDNIFVEMWEEPSPPRNGPTLAGREEVIGPEKAEEVYLNRKYFDYGEVGKAADYIYDQMRIWYSTKTPRPALERVDEGLQLQDDMQKADEVSTTVEHVQASRALDQAIAAGDVEAMSKATDQLNDALGELTKEEVQEAVQGCSTTAQAQSAIRKATELKRKRRASS